MRHAKLTIVFVEFFLCLFCFCCCCFAEKTGNELSVDVRVAEYTILIVAVVRRQNKFLFDDIFFSRGGIFQREFQQSVRKHQVEKFLFHEFVI